MKSSDIIRRASVVAAVSLCASCATWNEMDRSEKGTAVGGAGGALVGAAVGGPVGAVVGAGIGAYAGHYEGFGRPGPHSTVSLNGRIIEGRSLVSSVQSSLNQRGYNAGRVDGLWGPSTETALRQFQADNGLAPSGSLNHRTLAMLGVA